MAVTETTNESWISRLGGAVKGVVAGIAFFVLAFPLLFWNEGNCVKTAKALDEGEGACISVENNETIDPEMDGCLVHMTGRADTQDVLTDDLFGVSATAIGLVRKTEMLQWRENSEKQEKKKIGGGVTTTTTYTYELVWSEDPIDSSQFKEQGHDNPGFIEFPSEKKVAEHVSFGAFRLEKSQIARIGEEQAYAFPADFVCKVSRAQRQGNTIFVPNKETRDNELNTREVASQARVGDMRVTFFVVKPHDISIVAKQRGDTFVSYMAKTKKKVNLLQDGIVDCAEMFEDARDANALFAWVIRFAGFFLMYIGLSMVLRPLSVLGDVIPILGTMIGWGTGLVAGVVALVCSLVTIAVAWIVYRPVLGVLLLIVAGAVVYLTWKKKNGKTSVQTASA
ncbi:MAG: TMEM43 family protein [Kiritimatiellia bacterium]